MFPLKRFYIKICNFNHKLDINECDEPSSCHEFSSCSNNIGSYECFCNDGFVDINESDRADETECVDINECEIKSDDCDGNSRCQNEPIGSYRFVLNKVRNVFFV